MKKDFSKMDAEHNKIAFSVMQQNTITVIIPAKNEATQLPVLLNYLNTVPGNEFITEIIVSDGKSTDETVTIANFYGAKAVISQQAGRGKQMNTGAKNAKGNILYFLHADSIPPTGFVNDILKQISQGYDAGCYRLRFDYDHWFLRANAWFTRFNVNAVRFGDQSLFVRKLLFETIGGFREDLIIMEDQEIIRRIRKKGRFAVIAGYVTTSARKYKVNGIYRMQAIFFYIYFAYLLGASQQKLVGIYKKWIRPS
ncbi:MAG: TIGR04283 family arsenosugar biosynthesis glycosyltransferase [Ferruginibacter sp.]